MTKPQIAIVVVGYKDKNIVDHVKHLKMVTESNNFIHVIDQHPISHEKEMSEISGCNYRHIVWDSIDGPAKHRSREVYDALPFADYVCIVSPDIYLKQGWDTELIEKMESKSIVFSGSGTVMLSQDSPFSFQAEYESSSQYNTTQFVDRNFIFARASVFSEIVSADFLKYRGENEYLSLAFLSAGYDILSVPNEIYEDSLARSVENTYHTFSAEHNYNIVIDLINGTSTKEYKISQSALYRFLEFHGIDPVPLKKLPYQTNDVNYDPYTLKIHGVDARRFISGTKAVY